jgi:hypothetical protein
MKKEELKPILKDFLIDMMNEWFDDKPLWKTLGNSLISANIDKYDNVLDMFADKNGDIDIEGILNSVGDVMEDVYKIDLQEFSPLLPSRLLLISKEDINKLTTSIKR